MCVCVCVCVCVCLTLILAPYRDVLHSAHTHAMYSTLPFTLFHQRNVQDYNGGLVAETPAGSRAELLVRGSWDEAPLKLKSFW